METVHTDKAPKALGPYSQAKVSNGMVYLSGQIGIIPETGEFAQGLEAQVEQVCKNIGAVLEAAGSDYSKVVKTTCLLANIEDFAAFNEIYAKYFISKPARSCFAVKDIPAGMLVEVEVIAEV